MKNYITSKDLINEILRGNYNSRFVNRVLNRKCRNKFCCIQYTEIVNNTIECYCSNNKHITIVVDRIDDKNGRAYYTVLDEENNAIASSWGQYLHYDNPHDSHFHEQEIVSMRYDEKAYTSVAITMNYLVGEWKWRWDWHFTNRTDDFTTCNSFDGNSKYLLQPDENNDWSTVRVSHDGEFIGTFNTDDIIQKYRKKYRNTPC